MKKFSTILQTNWDWRAAGNFMFGGTGSALLVMMALTNVPGALHIPTGLIALALVGTGLGLVWLEIGRPWRALHVYFNPQTSWMTREGIVALFAFSLTFVGLLLQNKLLIALAGIAGAAYLFCQSQMLRASKGIPAWREPAVVALIITTGLTEATALLLVIASLVGHAPDWLSYALLVFLGLRAKTWFTYRNNLKIAKAPTPALTILDGITRFFIFGGNVLPAILVILALFTVDASTVFTVSAGFTALLAGWYLKFTIVTRAAQVQGYSFGKLKRGHPLGLKPSNTESD